MNSKTDSVSLEKFDHRVLVVDDEEAIGRAVKKLLGAIEVTCVNVNSAHEALEEIKASKLPFSLVLSDERMVGMSGTELLEQTKEISPDTIRYLMTGYTGVDSISDAVNKGSIHRYIAKPWDAEVLLEAIKAGLNQFELIVENHRLFKLAKEQTTKLYSLNLQLKKNTAAHKETIAKLDKKIHQLKFRLEKKMEQTGLDQLKAWMKSEGIDNADMLKTCYPAVLYSLFNQFKSLANQNDFDMPDRIVEEKDAG